MSAIITRAGKGSPLTNAEVDSNFTNLNSGKAEQSITISAGSGLTGGGDLSANRTLSLDSSGVLAGSYGGNNSIPSLTIDAFGRVTLAGAVTPSGTWDIGISGNAATASAVPFSGITSKPTTLAGYGITDAQEALVSGTTIKTINGDSVLGAGNILIDPGVTSFNTRSGSVTLSSTDVTDALGFTPYNSSNPNGYITSSGNAATATAAQNATFLTQPNASWGGQVQLGGNGGGSGVALIATVQATDGNLHIDSGSGKALYLNYYQNGIIYLNGTTYSISSNGASYNGTAAVSSKLDSSVRNYSREWIEFPNYTGLYSPNNAAHFKPNDGSYGAWKIDGSRNGWQGIEFQNQATLMMNDDTYGFHRNIGGGWRFYCQGGSGHFPGNVVAYWSDRRLKENFQPIGRESIEILSAFTTYRFNWNAKAAELGMPIEPGKEEIGLVAQDVQARLADAVQVNKSANKLNEDGSQDETDYLTIIWDRITPLLVGAVNIHEQDIQRMQAEIAELRVLIAKKV